jgi:hypothetical protein
MSKGHATVLAAIGILAISALVSGQAQAGASASAPSKYRPNQVGVAHQERQVQKPGLGITEFSSSAKKTSQRQSRE